MTMSRAKAGLFQPSMRKTRKRVVVPAGLSELSDVMASKSLAIMALAARAMRAQP